MCWKARERLSHSNLFFKMRLTHTHAHAETIRGKCIVFFRSQTCHFACENLPDSIFWSISAPKPPVSPAFTLILTRIIGYWATVHPLVTQIEVVWPQSVLWNKKQPRLRIKKDVSVWLGLKSLWAADLSSPCHTCPLYWPQIPQLFVRGWQHTDTEAKKTHTRTEEKKSHMKKGT